VAVDPLAVESLADAFAAVPDPRSVQGRRHGLVSILLIAACATTCDADGLTAVCQWAQDAPQQVLARLRVRVDPLTGMRSPPSERTIRRVLARVDPQAVQDAAGAFTAGRSRQAGLGPARPPVQEREQRRARGRTRPPGRPAVAFDGKALRGARRGGRPVMLLGAARHGTGTVIAQRMVAGKSNEIPELRTMLAGLDLRGALVTADAAHCQRATAEAIVAAGADYLLTVKANQANLLSAVAAHFAGADTEWADRSHHSLQRGHGRVEWRTVRLAPAVGVEFPHAAQVLRTVRYRGGLDGQRTAKQVVYGITSLAGEAADPAKIAAAQRGHWGIENRTHHVRDVTFDEDRSQVRTGHAPQNMAALRNLAIDTLRCAGYVNIAHARRHHAHDYHRVVDLYGLRSHHRPIRTDP
jgi:predicted transposase YbfD/YdcC